MMSREEQILDAWVFLRKNNSDIPSEFLDWMKRVLLYVNELENQDKPVQTEFEKQNRLSEGEESLFIYSENGYLFIDSTWEETHTYALNIQELNSLIKVLINNKEFIYRDGKG